MQFRTPPKPEDAEASDRAMQAIVSAIDTLVDGLSPAKKEWVLRSVTEKLRPVPVPQAGDVLGIVVQLLPRKGDWSIAELKKRIDDQAVPVTQKEIYNALGYLTRKGHIQRVGYGRYMIGGIPVVTADEVGGQPSITDEDLDN